MRSLYFISGCEITGIDLVSVLNCIGGEFLIGAGKSFSVTFCSILEVDAWFVSID